MLRNFSFNISGCSKVKVFNDLRGGAAPHPGALGLSSTVPSKVGNGAISDMTPQFIYFGWTIEPWHLNTYCMYVYPHQDGYNDFAKGMGQWSLKPGWGYGAQKKVTRKLWRLRWDDSINSTVLDLINARIQIRPSSYDPCGIEMVPLQNMLHYTSFESQHIQSLWFGCFHEWGLTKLTSFSYVHSKKDIFEGVIIKFFKETANWQFSHKTCRKSASIFVEASEAAQLEAAFEFNGF